MTEFQFNEFTNELKVLNNVSALISVESIGTIFWAEKGQKKGKIDDFIWIRKLNEFFIK